MGEEEGGYSSLACFRRRGSQPVWVETPLPPSPQKNGSRVGHDEEKPNTFTTDLKDRWHSEKVGNPPPPPPSAVGGM